MRLEELEMSGGDARYFKGRGWMADTIMPFVTFLRHAGPIEAYLLQMQKHCTLG